MALFRRLLPLSIVSVNIGYTGFLYPVLGILYPDRIPLTLYNLLAFIITDTLWGVILAFIIYLIIHLTKISPSKAILVSTTLLWLNFWMIALLSSGNILIHMDEAVILGTDGIAALITCYILSKLVKHYIQISLSGSPGKEPYYHGQSQ